MNTPTVSIVFERKVMVDESADLSYLEQDYADVTDPAQRAEYRHQDAERIRSYNRGNWHMVGVRAVAHITVTRGNHSTLYTLESAGLWGIESDSGEDYLGEVYAEQCAELQADIDAIRSAT